MDDGVKVNNFDEMKVEIIDHIQDLKDQGINVKINEDQIKDLIKRILDKKEKTDKEKDEENNVFKNFSKIYKYNIENIYEKKISTENMNVAINDYIYNNNLKDLINEYNLFSEDIKKIANDMRLKKVNYSTDKQRILHDYWKDLEKIVNILNHQGKGSVASRAKGEGLKILTNKQMLNRLPILLVQIQARNNSKSLKNELRQILYSLYRSKVLTKTVYNNLIKVIV